MKTVRAIRAAALTIILLAGFAGCGHKGVLLAPLSRIPSPPSDIHLIQRGARIVLEWKNPTTFNDGHPLAEIAAVDIWMLEETVEAAKPADKAAEKLGDKPAANLTENAANKPEEKSTAKPAESTANKPEEKPTATPADKAIAKLTDKAADKLAAQGIASPATKPAIKPLTAEDFAAKASLLATVTKDQFPVPVKAKTAAEKTPGQEASPPKKKGEMPKREKPPVPPPLRYEYDLKPDTLSAKRYMFGLKAEISKRKVSDFSSLAAIKTRALPSAPAGLQAVVGNAAIELSWDAPADNIDGSKPALLKGYNLYRSEGDAPAVRLNPDLAKETHFTDKTFEFDKDYVYTVRAATEDKDPFWESADSAPAPVKPKDVFAPAAPKGLASLAGTDFISLTWDPNPDKDLAGYRVWRRVAGQGDFHELTTALIKETTFQDKAVEKGRRYEYAVTAEDAQGNRSPLSTSVSEQIKEGRR